MLAAKSRGHSMRWYLALLVSFACAQVQAGQDYIWKDVRDPRLGNALFHLYQDKNFTGSIQSASDLTLGRAKLQQDDTVLVQTMLNMAYGLHRGSAAKFSMLFNKESTPIDFKNYVWFYIAKIRHQRGNYADAESALANVKGALPWELDQQLQFLTATMLMERKDYSQAAKQLSELRGRTSGVPFARFNAAVGLMKSKQKEKAIPLLIEIGNNPGQTKEHRLLQDRANLGLGYLYLFDNKSKPAIERFERVRLNSLYSNEAMLGLGWAYYNLEQYERALAVWDELSKRNVADIPVQEARIAVPYTLARLGSFGQANTHYSTAMSSFKEEIKLLERITEKIQNSEYFETLVPANDEGDKGWNSDVENLTLDRESYYFTQMLATNEFQEAVKGFRDMRFLLMKFDQWDADLKTYEEESKRWVAAVQARGTRIAQSNLSDRLLGMRMELDRVNQQLEAAEQRRDVYALVTEQERQQLDRIELLAKQSLSAEQKERLRLVRGRVIWQVYSQFNERVRLLKVAVKDANAAVEVSGRQQANLQEIVQGSAAKQQTIANNIVQSRQKIKRQRPAVNSALQAMNEHIKKIAIADLDRRKEALSDFIAQAAYSVGQGFDPGASK